MKKRGKRVAFSEKYVKRKSRYRLFFQESRGIFIIEKYTHNYS